jgi:hypothetical protein
MILEGLSDLKPDPKKGIEGSRRILGNEGNLISPYLLSLFGILLQNVLAFKENFSGHDSACRLGHHSHKGLTNDALAAGRFSDQAPHLLLSHGEVHAFHSADYASVRVEMDLKILDL